MNEHESPTGELMGDSKPMPDRGSSTGVTDTYGADLSPTATNGMGRITGATRSDPMDRNCPKPSPTV